jgi:hypothetical protein
MGKVLGIVYRTIATHLIKKAGFTRKTAHTGAVTLIQCFGGALNLNVHFHMLFLDGAYVDDANGSVARFQWVIDRNPEHAGGYCGRRATDVPVRLYAYRRNRSD